MTDDYKKEYVKKHFLSDAVFNIVECGRYWNGAISRTMTSALRDALKAEGYDVTVIEVPPDWEHVFTLAGVENSDLIKKIAYIRAQESELGIEEYFKLK